MIWRLFAMSALTSLLVGCGGGTSQPTVSSTEADDAVVELGAPVFTSDVPGAVALDIAGNGVSDPTVAWIGPDGVWAATIEISTGVMAPPSDVDMGLEPIVHPIERPAVAVAPDGRVDIAFTSFVEDGAASVFLSQGGSEPEPISGDPEPETNLVHVTLMGGRPVLSWLEDATLSVGVSDGGHITERESVDDRTCDCCNPVPLAVGESLVVAYRDFETVDGQVVRNVAAVSSADGGVSFSDVVPIADDDWFISGCPFSGPDVASVDGELLVAWMDGRQSIHPDQASTSIWVDRSTDGGASFGSDIKVAGEGINRWPVLAVDASSVAYLVWEKSGPEGGLAYASSSDGGHVWQDHGLLVARGDTGSGDPRSPSLIVHDGHLVVTWADSVGGHVAAWSLQR
ncbi:MAG: sialidase family protein [Acidimicrobiia bacterium]